MGVSNHMVLATCRLNRISKHKCILIIIIGKRFVKSQARILFYFLYIYVDYMRTVFYNYRGISCTDESYFKKGSYLRIEGGKH
ncbi:hypothetical protein PAJ34TS1_29350 [Paenibacillus azoreducens]